MSQYIDDAEPPPPLVVSTTHDDGSGTVAIIPGQVVPKPVQSLVAYVVIDHGTGGDGDDTDAHPGGPCNQSVLNTPLVVLKLVNSIALCELSVRHVLSVPASPITVGQLAPSHVAFVYVVVYTLDGSHVLHVASQPLYCNCETYADSLAQL